MTVSVLAPADLVATLNQGLLESIVSNLAGNALKYTDHGTIHLRGRVEARRLTIEIEDTGRGLGQHVADLATERFFQAAPHESHGFGLGLSIAQQAATILGAALTLGPALPHGTIARLTLAPESTAESSGKLPAAMA